MPHWELQTSSLNIASLGHCLINWPQSVIRKEAHWAWKVKQNFKLKVFLQNNMLFTTYAFCRAHTAGTGWGESGFAYSNMTIAYLTALNIFTPGTQINLWHRMTRYSWIPKKNFQIICEILKHFSNSYEKNLQEIAGQIKSSTLHVTGYFQILTGHFGQCGLAYFG